MTTLSDYLHYATFLRIAMLDWVFLVVALVAGIVLRAAVLLVLRRLLQGTRRTRTRLDELLIDALLPVAGATAVLLALWIGTEQMILPREPVDVDRFVRALRIAAAVFMVVWFLIRLNNRVAAWNVQRATETRSPIADVIPLVRTIVSVFLIALGLLIIVQLLGYTITSLVAGLGIGGLALGLAARGGMGSFFGSLVIFLDRPFTRGDFIRMGEHEGIVLDSSVRVTHLRGFDGSLITVPNSLMTTAGVVTWGHQRRISHVLSFTYDSQPEQLAAFVERARERITLDARFQRENVVVAFTEVGDYSLNVLLTCYTVTTLYAEYVELQQELLLNVLRIARELGLELAFPTRTIVGVPGATGGG